jgi:hypothetical protein
MIYNLYLFFNSIVVVVVVVFLSHLKNETVSNNLKNHTVQGEFTNSIYRDLKFVCRDTLIKINEKFSLKMNCVVENGSNYFNNPQLHSNFSGRSLNLNMIIKTTKIEEFDFKISKNQKFMVMYYISDNGYVYKSEKDSIYHEIYTCSMFELEDGNIIKLDLSPIEMNGNWDNHNKWVDEDGMLLIDPLKVD